jgi:hypothetical protein
MLAITSLLTAGALASTTTVDPDAIDPASLARLAPGDAVVVEGLPLAADEHVDLVLERFEVLTADAPVVIAGRDGEQPWTGPRPVLLRGRVAGEPGSHAFLGVSSRGVQGFVDRDGSLHFVSTGPYAAGAIAPPLMTVDAGALPAPALESWCAVDVEDDQFFPFGRPEPVVGVRDGSAPCRAARVAIDTDYEFTANLFGGDVDASADYALFLMAAVSEIFRRDVNTRLFVSYLRVWADDVDPYDAETSGEALNQLRDHWRAQHGDVERETAHLLSGDNLGGGVAWLSVVCSTVWGYAVSGNLGGTFPYPLMDHSHSNWDPFVVAHELGHNYGTLHTHDGYEPPLDECGLGGCDAAYGGTIMSYCHGCPGGMSNIVLNFHPTVIDQILGYLDGVPCDVSHSGPVAADDAIRTYEGADPIVVDMLANDIHASCDGDEIALDDYDTVSTAGGTIVLLPAGGGSPRDRLEYTMPAGFDGLDTFTYRIVGGAEATVEIDIEALRDPDSTGATAAGAFVAYYALEAPEQLPDFDTLVPYADDVLPNVDIPLTGGDFATSGRRIEVGAVFEGFVTVPADGPYTFYTLSDDGSALFIGDERVVSNDGVHGAREESGDILLHAGPHAIRIEYFNNTGGSTLIARIAGPGLPKQVIEPDAWSHPTCADLDGSGAVDTADLVAVLAAWGPCTCPEDLDGSGSVDTGDLIIVLAAWGPCP